MMSLNQNLGIGQFPYIYYLHSEWELQVRWKAVRTYQTHNYISQNQYNTTIFIILYHAQESANGCAYIYSSQPDEALQFMLLWWHAGWWVDYQPCCWCMDVFLSLRAHRLRRQGLVVCLICAEDLPRLDSVLYKRWSICSLWNKRLCTQLDCHALCIEQQLGPAQGVFLSEFALLGWCMICLMSTCCKIYLPARQTWTLRSCS